MTAAPDRGGPEPGELEALETLVDNAPVGFGVFDRGLRCVRANDALAAVSGRSARDLLGERIQRALPTLSPSTLADLHGLFVTGEPLTGMDLSATSPGPTGRAVHWSASFYPVRSRVGAVLGVGVALTDITARRRLEQRLAHLATHDPLTDLGNRTLFLERVGEALARARRAGRLTAVLFIDLDDFKTVNDTFGHAAGDELLRTIARRLQSTSRPGDFVARLGGDEFALLCEDLQSATDVAPIAQRVLHVLRQPVTVAGRTLAPAASIGVGLADSDLVDAEGLTAQADTAMYRAKHEGGGGVEFFDASVRDRARYRLTTVNELRHALEDDQFCLLYQPQVSARDGRLVGYEALLRWRHPERGLLAPSSFLDLLESTRLIVPVGAWVLRQAVQALLDAPPPAGDGPPAAISVNLSAHQLSAPDIVDQIAVTVSPLRGAAGRLCLEITETALMEDPDAAARKLAAIAALGVTVRVDDFGTGYSSLSRLRTLPIHGLKVDRSLVSSVADEEDGRVDRAIVAAIVALAAALGIDAVAEGVESHDQLDRLSAMGFDELQGYHTGRPGPPWEPPALPSW